jgi:hypothetical protein
MIDARTFTLLDLLHCGHLAPHPGQPNYETLMAEWITRYRARLEAATRLLETVAAIEAEEPACPPSP